MTRRALRIASGILLLVALVFLGVALTHPEFGSTFAIFGIRIGATVWRGFYLGYLVLTILLFVLSFFVKKK